jgi:nucleoside-diphosphate-sugar epimerase
MKNILITGAAGFIGFHLAKSFSAKDAKVTVIDNLSRGRADAEFNDYIAAENVRYIQCDLTTPDYHTQLDDYYDEVYHLAAVNGTKFFYEKPQEVLRVNILALLYLLEWASPEHCGKFLFSSSSEAYAGTISAFPNAAAEMVPTREDIPLCIDDVFNARYSYGGSKLAGELLTINYLRSKGVPFSILRYHNVYGPRMGFEHVIPEFSKRIYDKQNPFEIYGGGDTRAFCYVTDAVAGTRLVMENSACDGHVVHVGNSLEETQILSLAEKMLKLAGFNAPLNVRPSKAGSVLRRCPDTGKLTKLTGYSPKVPLNEGLKLTLDWYMDYFGRNDAQK